MVIMDAGLLTTRSRRESMGEWWGEEGGSGIGGGEEPASVASIKSTSSVDHDPPIHTFSTLTQYVVSSHFVVCL